jgi:hypothetical protein
MSHVALSQAGGPAVSVQRARTHKLNNRYSLPVLLTIMVVLVTARAGQAQDATAVTAWQQYPLSSELATALCGGIDPSTTSLANRARIPLYRMMPGFLGDPANFARSDDTGEGQASDNGILVNLGDDNLYFDPRRPGAPGGTGYYRLFSQMQVLDTGSTSVCLGLKAWMPTGAEFGGVDGHSYFAPGVGVFQDLGNGSGLHGFVGQNWCAAVRNQTRQAAMECGMAVHCPVPGLVEPTCNGVYMYVQALGRYGYQNSTDGKEMELELVPGVHWRVSDSFWMSLAASRRGMLTCSWQY